MKVSIHQPQYLPWLPYFQKIEQSDLFIFLDSVDYQKNGLQNRNKIKGSNGGQWLTVPVIAKLGQKILDIKIDNSQRWSKKHLSAIQQNYGKAEHFKYLSEIIANVYSQNWENLAELNIFYINQILKIINIDTTICRSSELECEGNSTTLILNLCKKVGATQYLTGYGAENYLDFNEFKNANIEVEFFNPPSIINYPQVFKKIGFVDGLSCIDILFNCGFRWRDFLEV